jgi:urea transport system permease protein
MVKLIIKIFIYILIVIPVIHNATADDSPDFSSSLQELASSKFKIRTKAVTNLVSLQDTRLAGVINALLSSKLYYRKSDKLVGIVSAVQSELFVADALTGEKLGIINKRNWKKVIISNKSRTELRDSLAMIELNDSSAEIRNRAVRQALTQLDVSQQTALEKRLIIESDKDVKASLNIAIATFKLKQGVGDTLALIASVKSSLHKSVRRVLIEVSENNTDTRIRESALAALKGIDTSIGYYDKVETLFFGLSLGSVLLLAAIGLAITFGVMGVINMAHGELIMLGAYTTYVVQMWLPNLIEYSVLIAIPLAFVVSGTVGVLIERGVIRFLHGRPLETLLATFGVSLVLQQVVRSIFGPLNRAVESPEWMSGVWQVNDALALTWNRLYIIIFALVVFFILLFILKKTTLGLKVRAVSQNRSMARAMGVKANWVDAMTFGLGSGIAGVAGVALSQLTNVGPNLGQAYIIDSFMVVVFGGVGNLWGTLVAGLSLGITNKLLEPWAGAVLAKIIVLVFIILFIQKRPNGLFPQKGRAAT